LINVKIIIPIWRTQGRRKRNSSSPMQTSEKKILELSEDIGPQTY
jgi:hypothetical protein